jgi:hypothetical protein
MFFNLIIAGLVVLAIALAILWQQRQQRRADAALIKSPGSHRQAVSGSQSGLPLVHQVADLLEAQYQLAGPHFRKELGELYPELRMAFRQSLQMGLMRYVPMFWGQPLSGPLVPSVALQVALDVYGIPFPAHTTLHQAIEAIEGLLRRKRVFLQLVLTTSQGHTQWVFRHKDDELAVWPLEGMAPDNTLNRHYRDLLVQYLNQALQAMALATPLVCQWHTPVSEMPPTTPLGFNETPWLLMVPPYQTIPGFAPIFAPLEQNLLPLGAMGAPATVG